MYVQNTTRKLGISLGLLFLIAIVPCISLINVGQTQINGSSLSTRETHAPIQLIGNAALAAFCTEGDGLSWATAYIIENLEIDAGGTGTALEIQSTDAYLIIRNCTTWNSGSTMNDAGIKLADCRNVKVTGCSAKNNKRGIMLHSSPNNVITGNNASNSGWGGIYLLNSNNNLVADNFGRDNVIAAIWVHSSRNNTVFNNTLLYNTNQNGIYLLYAQNNTVLGNNASFSSFGTGIHLYGSSENLVASNNLSDHRDGITLLFSNNNTFVDNIAINNDLNGFNPQNSNFNTFSRNYATQNRFGIHLFEASETVISWNNLIDNTESGILISYSSDNVILGNNASENSVSGITIGGSSSNNAIFRNSLIQNTAYSYATGSGNSWDNGYVGNYWGDYEIKYPSASTTTQGVVWDTPYAISGTTSEADNFPLEKESNIIYTADVLGVDDDDCSDVTCSGFGWVTPITWKINFGIQPELFSKIFVEFKAKIIQPRTFDYDYFSYFDVNNIGYQFLGGDIMIQGTDYSWYGASFSADFDGDGNVDWIEGENDLILITWSGYSTAAGISAWDVVIVSLDYDGDGIPDYKGGGAMAQMAVIPQGTPDLDLHVYDSEGHHVGFNYETDSAETEIVGAFYSGDNVDGTEWIFIPADVVDYQVVIDARDATLPTEEYQLTLTTLTPEDELLEASVTDTIEAGDTEAWVPQVDPETGELEVVPLAVSMVETLKVMIVDSPDSAWEAPAENRKTAMLEKLDTVLDLYQNADYVGCYNKLLHDVKPKLTGLKVDEEGDMFGNGAFKNPWVTDPDLQQEFGTEIDSILLLL